MFEPKGQILTALYSKPAKSSSAARRTDELMEVKEKAVKRGGRGVVEQWEKVWMREGGTEKMIDVVES